MERPIFVYGTLRDADVRQATLGDAVADIAPIPAQYQDHRAYAAMSGPYPALRAEVGASAPGLLLAPGSQRVTERLDALEVPFGYTLEDIDVTTAEGPRPARVYRAGEATADTGEPWDLEAWAASDKPLFLEMVREHVRFGPLGRAQTEQHRALGLGVLRRAIARINAADRPATRLGTPGGLVEEIDATRLSTGFHALEERRFRHSTFAGGMTGDVLREVLVNGDVVCILPWDPVRDLVQLIEQVRIGPIARADPNPWCLEIVAGLVDKVESLEEAARREAAEEGGLTLGRVERLGAYYPSPGVQTEHVTAFVGEATLEEGESFHGLAEENEDIRALVVPRARAMAALDDGEIQNAPAILALLALDRRADQLKGKWGL